MNYKTERYLHSMDTIVALQPIIIGKRNGCRVLYRDGSQEVVRNVIKYVMERLAANCMHMNLAGLHNQYRQLTGETKARKVPVLLSADCILVPLRLQVINCDGEEQTTFSQGYISLSDYSSHTVNVEDGTTMIHLKSFSDALLCEQSSASTEHQLQRAVALRISSLYERKEIADEEKEKYTQLLLHTASLESNMEGNPYVLTEKERNVMYELLTTPWITYQELALRLDCSKTKVARIAGSLRKRQFIERQGTNRDGSWIMAPLMREYLRNMPASQESLADCDMQEDVLPEADCC